METCSSHAKSKKKLIQPEVHSFQEIIGQKPLKKRKIFIHLHMNKNFKIKQELWKTLKNVHAFT